MHLIPLNTPNEYIESGMSNGIVSGARKGCSAFSAPEVKWLLF